MSGDDDRTPASPATESKQGSWAILATFLTLCLLGIGGIFYQLQSQSTTVEDVAASSENDAKKSVAKDFLDPGSATFRNIIASSTCVSGQVNAKNAFGAYTGYRDFFYDVRRRASTIGPDLDVSLMGSKAGLDNIAARNAYIEKSLMCGR